MKKNNQPIDVILIYPKTGVDLAPAIAPPFSVLRIAAPLHKQGANIKIIDQRVDKDWATHLKVALKDKPICCGISTMTGKQIYFGVEAAKVIRGAIDGNLPIVWGGVHPSLLPEQTAKSPYVDIVCIGEGDETFPELVAALTKNRPLSEVKGITFLDGDKVVSTGSRPFINIEEMLPTPWELVTVESYINPDLYLRESRRVLDVGQTSRGCPYRCAYCYNPTVHHSKWRAMSAEKVLNIVEENVSRFNLDGIWFRDDEFFLDLGRVTKICEGIIAKGFNISWYTSGASIADIVRASDEQLRLLRKSGAHILRIGAESGSDRVLKFLKKKQTAAQILQVNRRCQVLGFKPVYSLMVGMPTETFEEINQTIELFFQLKKENSQASLAPLGQFTAFPGTPLYDIAIEMGLRPPRRFEDWADWLSTERDSTGERLAWFNKKERRWLSNLIFLGNLSYAGTEMISAIKNKPLSNIFNLIMRQLAKYFSWRLRRKSYRFVPELGPILAASRLYLFLLNRNKKS